MLWAYPPNQAALGYGLVHNWPSWIYLQECVSTQAVCSVLSEGRRDAQDALVGFFFWISGLDRDMLTLPEEVSFLVVCSGFTLW